MQTASEKKVSNTFKKGRKLYEIKQKKKKNKEYLVCDGVPMMTAPDIRSQLPLYSVCYR